MRDSDPDFMVTLGVSRSEHHLAMLAYILHLCAIFTLFSSVAGVVINYIKRNESPVFIATHHRWMIHTFWWSAFFLLVGFPLVFLFGLGYLIIFATAIWWIYRHVRGLIALIEDRPVPV